MTTDIIYRYKNQVYFNITNKCPCRCTFCIRNTEDAIGEASNLWFEHEPALEEIYKAINEFDFSDCNEVVFCGYGEPTMALVLSKRIAKFQITSLNLMLNYDIPLYILKNNSFYSSK